MKRSKIEFGLFIVCMCMCCLKIGVIKTAFVLFLCMLVGSIIILPFWLVGFIIGLVCTKSLSETWHELNPAKMVKECFFSSNG